MSEPMGKPIYVKMETNQFGVQELIEISKEEHEAIQKADATTDLLKNPTTHIINVLEAQGLAQEYINENIDVPAEIVLQQAEIISDLPEEVEAEKLEPRHYEVIKVLRQYVKQELDRLKNQTHDDREDVKLSMFHVRRHLLTIQQMPILRRNKVHPHLEEALTHLQSAYQQVDKKKQNLEVISTIEKLVNKLPTVPNLPASKAEDKLMAIRYLLKQKNVTPDWEGKSGWAEAPTWQDKLLVAIAMTVQEEPIGKLGKSKNLLKIKEVQHAKKEEGTPPW